MYTLFQELFYFILFFSYEHKGNIFNITSQLTQNGDINNRNNNNNIT